MTNEEAIRILDPDSKTVWKAYDGKDIERCNEACRMAVKALEKQIPKKPDEDTVNYGMDVSGEYRMDYNYVCPICRAVVGNYEIDHHWFDFCPGCGQALDWRMKK